MPQLLFDIPHANGSIYRDSSHPPAPHRDYSTIIITEGGWRVSQAPFPFPDLAGTITSPNACASLGRPLLSQNVHCASRTLRYRRVSPIMVPIFCGLAFRPRARFLFFPAANLGRRLVESATRINVETLARKRGLALATSPCPSTLLVRLLSSAFVLGRRLRHRPVAFLSVLNVLAFPPHSFLKKAHVDTPHLNTNPKHGPLPPSFPLPRSPNLHVDNIIGEAPLTLLSLTPF